MDCRDLDEYKAAYWQIDYMVTMLESSNMQILELHDIECFLGKKGVELLRVMLQGYLERRKKAEAKLEQVIGADGVERKQVTETSERPMETLFGKVRVKRLGYNRYGSQNLHPLDAALNLPQGNYSYGLKERVAEEAARGSFDQGLKSVQQTTGGKVPKRQALAMVVDMSQDFEAFYEARSADEPEQTEDLLILSLDGKGIKMRPEGLKEATREAAENDKEKVETGLPKSKEHNHKRMATVSTVYTTERDARSPESIMHALMPSMKKDHADDKKPEAEAIAPTKPRAKRSKNRRVWASLKREPNAICQEVFQEATRRDPDKSRQSVVVIDGDGRQLKNVKSAIKRHQFKNTTIVLDFIHVLGYVWDAAHAFGFKDGDAASWVYERGLNILRGKVSDVAAGIRRSATLRRIRTAARKIVDTSVNYLLKYADLMQYDHYLESGFPIASGAIEGACRYLIKDRLDITGARWGLEGAEAVLKLRSLYSSGDFDAYWNYHRKQSFQRIHAARYQTIPYVQAA